MSGASSSPTTPTSCRGYLRFVRARGRFSADLPLNVSREMIQESPLLAAIRKGVTNRVLQELDKLADNEPEKYAKIWEHFGAVLKEGLYEDPERRDALFKLARFTTTDQSGEATRTLARYVAALKREPDGDLLSRRRRRQAPRRRARSSKASRRAASRCCCSPTRSTPSGCRRRSASTASRSSR